MRRVLNVAWVLCVSFLAVLLATGVAKSLVARWLSQALWSPFNALAFAAMVILSAVPLVLWIAREFRGITAAAQAIESGDLDARAPVKRGALSEDVARSFNAMARHVTDTVRQQEHLLQLLAHESLTPLARLRFSLDRATAARTDESRLAAFTRADQDIADLERLIDSVLAALMPVARRPKIGPVDPVAVTAAIIVRLPVHDGVQVRQEAVNVAGQRTMASELSIRTVVGNLVANAVRHAQSEVVVTIAADEATVCITVDDDGPGIPQDARDRLLRPFERMEDSRMPGSGYGLGLALAQKICLDLGFTLRIDTSPIGGARMETHWLC